MHIYVYILTYLDLFKFLLIIFWNALYRGLEYLSLYLFIEIYFGAIVNSIILKKYFNLLEYG